MQSKREFREMTMAVYFFNQLGSSKYKIGITNNLPRRLRQIQTAVPSPVVISSFIEFDSRKEAAAVEKTIHRILSGRKIYGEWFWLIGSDLDDLGRIYDLREPNA